MLSRMVRTFLFGFLFLVFLGGCHTGPSATIETLAFTEPVGDPCSDAGTDDGCPDLGWNLPTCTGVRLTWPLVREYPMTIVLVNGAPTDFLARFEVRVARDVLSDYVIGTFTADFNEGDRTPTIITGVDGGANRIPEDAQEVREAFWLGCTNEIELRGNGGQGPLYGGDVYVTLVETIRVSVNGTTTTPNQVIQCALVNMAPVSICSDP